MAPTPQRPGSKGGPSGNGSGDSIDERHRSEQLADECQELEESVEQLRARYEMWFLGVERREPNRDRDELKRRVERLKGVFTRNTGLKFRIQTLAARMLSYERMWLRSAREKEEGTYRRDLLRLRRQVQDRRPGLVSESSAPGATKPAAEPQPASPRSDEPRPAAPSPAPRPEISTPLPRVPPRPPPPPQRTEPPAAAPVGERQMRALYDAYIDAKKRCNEDVSRLSYEAVARSVQKQVPELMARHQAKSVEFKVVIQGGRAVLKAVPRS